MRHRTSRARNLLLAVVIGLMLPATAWAASSQHRSNASTLTRATHSLSLLHTLNRELQSTHGRAAPLHGTGTRRVLQHPSTPAFRRMTHMLRRLLHAQRPEGIAGRTSAAATNSQSLEIPWSQWPSSSTNETGGTIDAAGADNPADNFFATTGDKGGIHRETYTAGGMQGGYSQGANIAFNSSGDVGAGYWLGSYYGSDSQATNMVNDALGTLRSEGYQNESCGTPQQPNCQAFVFLWTDSGNNAHESIYGIESNQNAVAEVAVDGYVSSVVNNADTVVSDFAQLFDAGDATLSAAVSGSSGGGPAATPTNTTPPSQATSTPTTTPTTTPTATATTPPVIRPSIRIEGALLFHAVKKKLKPTHVVHLGDSTLFIVIYTDANAGSYTPSGRMRLISQTHHFKTGFIGLRRGTVSGRPVFYAPVGFGTKKSLLGHWLVRFNLKLGPAHAGHKYKFVVKRLSCKRGFHVVNGACGR